MRRCIGINGSWTVTLPNGVHRHQGDAFAINDDIGCGERAASADQEHSRRSLLEGRQRMRRKTCRLGNGDDRGAEPVRRTGRSPAGRWMRNDLAFPRSRGSWRFLQEHNINLVVGEPIPAMPPVDVPTPNAQHAWFPLECDSVCDLRAYASATHLQPLLAFV